MSAAARPAIVVGSGFGCRIHVPALRAAGFEVVGLVGTDPERTGRRANTNAIPHAFTDLDEAITRTGAEVVTVATPPHAHGPTVLKALSYGCHVLCEKPFARDTAEARAMLGAAERAGVVHLIGHEFRFAPERATIARAIADGLIGEPRFMTLAQYIPFVADPDEKVPRWWFDEQAGGGWLGASGSHTIDMVRTWLGEFESVSAALPIVSARENVAEDSFVLRFRMANGVEGVLQNSAGAWGPMASMQRVAGTHGTVWLDGNTAWIADRDGARALPVAPDLALPPPPPPSEDSRHRYSYLEFGPYARLCETLRDRIEDRSASSALPVATFADGVACMEVMDAIRASAAQGGALVTLPD